MRAVLWDADGGVLQHTPASAWDVAVQVVAQFPGAITGAPIDEARIRTVAHELGLGDRVDDIVAVWSTFDLLPTDSGDRCPDAGRRNGVLPRTNQDVYRAAGMRKAVPYDDILDVGRTRRGALAAR